MDRILLQCCKQCGGSNEFENGSLVWKKNAFEVYTQTHIRPANWWWPPGNCFCFPGIRSSTSWAIAFPACEASRCGPRLVLVSFLFLYFFKKDFTEIYFSFHILQFHTPTARQGGGRDLYVNKYKFYLRRGPWRGPAAPLSGGRPPAARQGGGRLPPRI